MGTDPVHPDPPTYAMMAEGKVEELERPASAFTNSDTKTEDQLRKRHRIDLSEYRQPWVMGCTAPLPQK